MKKKYDIKSAKELLLIRAGKAYYALGTLHSENTLQEEELIAYALFKVLEKDTGTEKQFLELSGLAYMLQGITENLRLLKEEATRVDFFDGNEQLF